MPADRGRRCLWGRGAGWRLKPPQLAAPLVVIPHPSKSKERLRMASTVFDCYFWRGPFNEDKHSKLVNSCRSIDIAVGWVEWQVRSGSHEFHRPVDRLMNLEDCVVWARKDLSKGKAVRWPFFLGDRLTLVEWVIVPHRLR